MVKPSLDELRSQIDALDDQFVDLLAQRFELIFEISELKKGSGEEVYQPQREQLILKRVVERGKAVGLNPLLLQALFIQIFAVSRRSQL